MTSFQPVQQREFPPYVWYAQMFSAPECAELVRLGESKTLSAGSVGNGIDGQFAVDKDYRCVQTSRIEEADAPWAFQRIVEKISACNAEHYRFDLTALHEGLLFLRYDAGAEPGHYKWHQDIGGGISSLRKLSMTCQLSDPADYDGGRLRLFTNMDFDPDHVGRGDAVVFPSYLPHCVTPITRGRRYALVAWCGGPQFR